MTLALFLVVPDISRISGPIYLHPVEKLKSSGEIRRSSAKCPPLHVPSSP